MRDFKYSQILCVAKVAKVVNLLSQDDFFQTQKVPKPVFDRDSARTPLGGGGYDTPQPSGRLACIAYTHLYF